MIRLKGTRRELAAAERASPAIPFDDGLAEHLRNGSSAACLRGFCSGAFIDRVDRHRPPIGAGHAGRLERNAAFANVAGGARRVAIAMQALEFLGRDLPVFEDVIEYGSRAFGGDALDQLQQFGIHERDHDPICPPDQLFEGGRFSAHRWPVPASTELLGDLTPRTYLLEDTPDTGPFVVKGETNSKRSLWKTHMYAANKREAIQVACRLMEDSLISEQRIYVRDFVPLETFGVGVDGVPIAREFRFFVLDGQVLCGAYYWANHTEFLAEHNIPTPQASEVPQEFLKRVTEAVGANVRFYVIDVAKTASGEWIVVELNDGQQSGLSENEPEKLYGALATHLRDDLCLTCKKNRGEARYDEGLACGRHCDTCWGAMLAECRSRSW